MFKAAVHIHSIHSKRRSLSAWSNTAAGVCLLGTGRSETAQQLRSPACHTAHHMSGITEEADRQHGKPQLSSTSGSAMRAMHDSSSSWTGSSLPPRARPAARHQAAVADTHTADADTSQIQHLQSAIPDGAVDMQRSTVVCVDQAMVARPDAEVAVVAAPDNGMSLLTLIASCISAHNTVHTVAHVTETGSTATIMCSQHKAVCHILCTWQASMDMYAAQSAYMSSEPSFCCCQCPCRAMHMLQLMTTFGQISAVCQTGTHELHLDCCLQAMSFLTSCTWHCSAGGQHIIAAIATGSNSSSCQEY